MHRIKSLNLQAAEFLVTSDACHVSTSNHTYRAIDFAHWVSLGDILVITL